MSMEIKKALLLGALSVGAFSFAGSAQADCTTDTDNQWECLEVGGTDVTGSGTQGPFQFSGSSQLSYGGIINATCTLNVEGEVDVDTTNNVAYITVTDGSVTGSGTCSRIDVAGFPWTAVDPSTGNPGINSDVYPSNTGVAVGDISGVEVTYFGGTICSGTIAGVEFANGNPVSQPSSFDFNGSVGACTVNGVVVSQGTDVNAW